MEKTAAAAAEKKKKNAHIRRNAEKAQWNEKSVDYCLANRKTKGNVLTKFSMEMRGFFASSWFGCVCAFVCLHSIQLDQVNCSGRLASPHSHTPSAIPLIEWALLHLCELLERYASSTSFCWLTKHSHIKTPYTHTRTHALGWPLFAIAISNDREQQILKY